MLLRKDKHGHFISFLTLPFIIFVLICELKDKSKFFVKCIKRISLRSFLVLGYNEDNLNKEEETSLTVEFDISVEIKGDNLHERIKEVNRRWASKEAPLMTKWSKDIDPENPHPEYPRPQLVRKKWKSLNGIWDFQIRG